MAHGTGQEVGCKMPGLVLSGATGPAGGAGQRVAPGLVVQAGGAGEHQAVMQAARAEAYTCCPHRLAAVAVRGALATRPGQ